MREGDGDLVHFWGRTLKDTMTKSLSQTQAKSEGYREVCEMVKGGRLPTQLLLLAYLSQERQRQAPVSVGTNGTDLLVVDHKLETQMLFRALSGQASNNTCLEVSQLQDVYGTFKRRLSKLEQQHGIFYPAYGRETNGIKTCNTPETIAQWRNGTMPCVWRNLVGIAEWLREHEVA